MRRASLPTPASAHFPTNENDPRSRTFQKTPDAGRGTKRAHGPGSSNRAGPGVRSLRQVGAQSFESGCRRVRAGATVSHTFTRTRRRKEAQNLVRLKASRWESGKAARGVESHPPTFSLSHLRKRKLVLPGSLARHGLASSTLTRTSAPLQRISGTYIAWPTTGSAWNCPGTSARRS